MRVFHDIWNTWIPFFGLIKPKEYVITADHFKEWRTHMLWSKSDGAQLRTMFTTRFGSMMVLMSLLLGSEVNVLFNSSQPGDEVRSAMKAGEYDSVYLWIGIILVVSIHLTIFPILSTFSAWATILAVSDSNIHVVLRSKVGSYVMALPGRMCVLSIYAFLTWVTMFMWDLLPKRWGMPVSVAVLASLTHLSSVYSAVERTVMYCGAMKEARIFTDEEVAEMYPDRFDEKLVERAREQKKKNIAVHERYSQHFSVREPEEVKADENV